MKQKKEFKLKTSVVLASTLLSGGLMANNSAPSAQNPFEMQEMSSGYMLADAHGKKKDMENKCGEGNCGEKEKMGKKKDMENKCGEGRCGEGRCGDKKKMGMEKDMENKCGEGSCGDKKKTGMKKDMENKRGEDSGGNY